jgi:hypothetical protein
MQTLFKLLLVTGLVLTFLKASGASGAPVSQVRTDTMVVEFEHLTDFNFFTKKESTKMVLIRQQLDTLLTLTYFNSLADTGRGIYFIFNTSLGGFKLVEAFEPMGLTHAFVSTKKPGIKLFKYELVNPAIDGDGAYIFSPEYGLVAETTYSEGMGLVLSKRKGKKIPKRYTDFLLKNNRVLFRKGGLFKETK